MALHDLARRQDTTITAHHLLLGHHHTTITTDPVAQGLAAVHTAVHTVVPEVPEDPEDPVDLGIMEVRGEIGA
ncbi:hypothetical protein J7T55_005538 [Diaporthe amygdali]|uniref:uncharacterized protein n=1 Tax=Phomopsis amygdali TaxID=1214568 RepID=UPI0022FE7B9A|nr:uncharacterized protein J7T55_005538 [Diaporthe amygdali]KAJ0108990.1 hypothetical protein J7T55_005538 [Diaporthe amygdali]